MPILLVQRTYGEGLSMGSANVEIVTAPMTTALPYYPPGSIIARRYTVLRALGRGAAGAVYLCFEQNQPNTTKAIKILSAKLADDQVLLARFYREGKVARQIESPFVVRSYDLIMDDGIFAYTMEYVPGVSLGDFLEDNPKPPLGFVVRALLQTGRGLQAIHEQDLIHRDLKPQNVLLTSEYHCKITDFGVVHLAKELEMNQGGTSLLQRISNLWESVTENADDRKLTIAGEILGTVDYVSPEYIRHGLLDQRSDIYSLGVMAFFMLTGIVPFEEGSLQERFRARVKNPAPNVAALRHDVPEEFCELVMSCLEREPKNRPQTAAQFCKALETARQKNSSMQPATNKA